MPGFIGHTTVTVSSGISGYQTASGYHYLSNRSNPTSNISTSSPSPSILARLTASVPPHPSHSRRPTATPRLQRASHPASRAGSTRFGASLRYIELPIELTTNAVLHELAGKCPNLTYMLLDFSTAMQLHDFSEMQVT